MASHYTRSVMTQLTYNEAFDPYHAVFRLMRLSQVCGKETATSFDMLRILDFYLLFPFRIQGISLFSEDIGWRAISKTYQWMAPYGGMPDDRVVFARMEPFQRAAVGSLVKSGYLALEEWNREEILFSQKNLPTIVAKRVADANLGMQTVTDILCQLRDRYPLLGKHGLKDRTKLLEHRYDSV